MAEKHVHFKKRVTLKSKGHENFSKIKNKIVKSTIMKNNKLLLSVWWC